MPDLFLSSSRLGRAELTCSLRMMLMMEGTRKEKKGLESLYYVFLKNLVGLLKSLVATAYVDCTACASCKRLCVEYTTFARKATYCVRIVRLFRLSGLFRTYTTCALKAACAYNVRLVRVSNLLRTYSTNFARKQLMRSK